MAQDAPYGQWGRPRKLGIGGTQIAVACKTDGKIVAFVLDGDTIHISEQTESGGGWGEWYQIDGGYTKILAVRNGFGQIVLFGITDEPAIYYSVQRGPGGFWDSWEQVAEETADLSVELGPDGRLYMAFVDSEDGVWCLKERQPGREWGDWEDLHSTCKQVVGLIRSAGPYEVYGLDSEGAVWRRRRSKGEWGEWESLGGLGYVQIDVFEDKDGELELFAVAESGRIYRRSRPGSGGGA